VGRPSGISADQVEAAYFGLAGAAATGPAPDEGEA
jgi:hypothetical protein